MQMRVLALVCVLAACGDSGLLLDVNPGSSDVKFVEVFVAKQRQGDYMGMPPANSPMATSGDVFEVAETVKTPLDGDGRARILLKPGSIDQVPALLVVGYDANHAAIRYAIVEDPKGPIMLRHTQADTIVVMLDPVKQTPVGMARMPAGATPRLVRWSADKMGDDLNGPCIGVIADDGGQGVKGTFFGPRDDLDCDNATPECDDNWYLKVEGAGHCVSDMIANDPFMGACRLGTTAGCVDNNPNSGVCTPVQQVVCGPSAFCDSCSNRTLEMTGCLADTAMSDQTARIDCQLLVQDGGNGTGTLCDTKTAVIDMAALNLLGTGWACNGVAGFTNYLDASNGTPLATLPINGTTAALGTQCHLDTSVLSFGIGAAAGTVVSDLQAETWGGMVFGVHVVSTTGDPHWLVLPIHLSYQTGTCPTDGTTPTLACTFSPGANAVTPNGDTIWNCAGVTR